MPIIKQEKWDNVVTINNDEPYGACCVNVARRVMEILDEEEGDFDTHSIICRADGETKAGGITGFMASMVASMVSQLHSRGEEFRKKWNIDNQIKDEGEKANKSGGTLNTAILNISPKEGQ